MNPFAKIWFWLLIISIIGFIATVIGFETLGQTTGNNTTTPIWIWVVFVLSIILFIMAFVFYAVDVSAQHRDREIAEACGYIAPAPPKKKIECPKRECYEKRIVQCVEKKKNPCEERRQQRYETQHQIKLIPQEQLVPNQKEEAFSASRMEMPNNNIQEITSQEKIRPLASLAPPTPIRPV